MARPSARLVDNAGIGADFPPVLHHLRHTLAVRTEAHLHADISAKEKS